MRAERVRNVGGAVVLVLMVAGLALFVAALIGAARPGSWYAAGACFIVAWLISLRFRPDHAGAAERRLLKESAGWTAATVEVRYLNNKYSAPMMDAARAAAVAHGYHEVPPTNAAGRWIWVRFMRDTGDFPTVPS